MTASSTDRTIVQVFAKAPVPGKVKTRLIPLLGPEGATELHCRLMRHTLATAALARIGPIEIWTTEPGEGAFLETCRRVLGLPIRLQPEGDLGVRMHTAASDGLRRGAAVIVLGCDCPTMHFDDLRHARDALASGEDAVLGPAEDGGYWLIGLARSHVTLFEAIPWSTPAVLDATRSRLATLGWRWRELDTRWDVDRAEDLLRLARLPSLSALTAGLIESGSA